MPKLANKTILYPHDFETHLSGSVTHAGKTFTTLAEFYDVEPDIKKSLLTLNQMLKDMMSADEIKLTRFLLAMDSHQQTISTFIFKNFVQIDRLHITSIDGEPPVVGFMAELKPEFQKTKKTTLKLK